MEKELEWFDEWLLGHANYETTKAADGFSLDAMLSLAAEAGSPQLAFNSLHVAGSKGKGSVSAMAASILHKLGYSTGLYTSPHILSFLERVTGPAGLPPLDVLESAARAVVDCAKRINVQSPAKKRPTWFELVTLFAMLSFKMSRYQWAVFETGLGGRLDATNILKPRACLITPIELEHTDYLGSTIKEIAGEKAGIIKKETPVFVAAQEEDAREVFAKRANELISPIFFMDEAISSIEHSYVAPKDVPFKARLSVTVAFNALKGGARFSRALSFLLQMPSIVQAENAALAAYAVKTLLPNIAEEAIEAGLESCRLPGRLEVALCGEAPVVLDGAHTAKSLKATFASFFSLFGEGTPAHLLFACAADKDARAMASLASGKFARVAITRLGGKRQSDIALAAKAFEEECRTTNGDAPLIIPDWNAAIEDAALQAKREGAALLITGSFYLLAEAKRILDLRS